MMRPIPAHAPATHPHDPPKSRCAIDECGRPSRGSGLCNMHEARIRRHGDPHIVKRVIRQTGENTPEMFWALVTPTGFCWEFGGKLTAEGYGMYSIAGISRGAHRIAYELLVGPIPDGMQLDHLCRTRHCVNPDHVEVITPEEHALRSNLHKTTRGACANGHPRTLADSLADGDKYYRCRQCTLVRTHRRRGRSCDYDAFCDAPSHEQPMKQRRALGAPVRERDSRFGVFVESERSS